MSESSAILIAGDEARRLPDKACAGVILTNPNIDELGIFEADVTGDNYATSENVIFYGYGNDCPHILRPSQTTIILPCKNAGQIFVKGRQGSEKRRVFYSLIM